MLASTRVFISYTTTDRETAQLLYDRPTSAGATVYEFERTAKPGDPAWEEIVRGINSSDFFIVLVSRISLQKQPVLEEVRQAHYGFVNRGNPS